jgi:hypothetical protein
MGLSLLIYIACQHLRHKESNRIGYSIKFNHVPELLGRSFAAIHREAACAFYCPRLSANLKAKRQYSRNRKAMFTVAPLTSKSRLFLSRKVVGSSHLVAKVHMLRRLIRIKLSKYDMEKRPFLIGLLSSIMFQSSSS